MLNFIIIITFVTHINVYNCEFMDFSNRLRKVLDYYQLSASTFAEKINVQRSSISHLLSGRNKPSLDFVMKVLETFDGVELYWLINGEGNFPKEEKKLEYASTLFSEIDDIQDEHILEKKTNSTEYAKEINPSLTNSDVEKIVVFYKNGTFKQYNEV